jgi:hypothetical protein
VVLTIPNIIPSVYNSATILENKHEYLIYLSPDGLKRTPTDSIGLQRTPAGVRRTPIRLRQTPSDSDRTSESVGVLRTDSDKRMDSDRRRWTPTDSDKTTADSGGHRQGDRTATDSTDSIGLRRTPTVSDSLSSDFGVCRSPKVLRTSMDSNGHRWTSADGFR